LAQADNAVNKKIVRKNQNSFVLFMGINYGLDRPKEVKKILSLAKPSIVLLGDRDHRGHDGYGCGRRCW
jgi:F420-dependent methylenetetrahydromethanopterin dehydrogenase